MNRLIIYCLVVFALRPVFAQEGDFFVSHFKPDFNHEEQTYFDVQFTSTDELVAANRAGIVKFDGRNWTMVPTPSSALSIAIDSSLNMFVGCVDDFGKIGIVDGQYRFISLAGESSRSQTFKTLVHEGKAFFLQRGTIIVHDIESQTNTFYYPDSADGAFINMVVFDGVIWAENEQSSYFLNDSIQRGNRILPDGSLILVNNVEPTTGNNILAGSEGNVYLYTSSFQKIVALSGKSITDLAWVSPELVAVSTLNEGVYFYDIQKKKIIGQTDSHNGLKDNEIFAIAADNASGLWVANTFGFTRIAPLLPIRSFNHYPGLDGNLTTAAYFKDTWNLATSNGIYYFDKVDNFKNIVYYVPKKQTKPQAPAPAKTTPAPATKTDQKFKIGNLFGRDKDEQSASAKSTNTQTLKASGTAAKKQPEQSKFNILGVFQKDDKKEGGFLSKIKLPLADNNKIQYERRVRKELVSTQYLYKKIEGIAEKCKQLIYFNNTIIAVTPSGIVEIDGNIATQIYEEPVRQVFHPKNSNTLWVSSKTGNVIRLDNIRGLWVEIQTLETPGDIVLSIYQDSFGTLWMAGANKLFEVIIENNLAEILDVYPLENQFFDNIRITELKSTLYFINTMGIFALDTAIMQIVRDDTLMTQTGQPFRHLLQSDGRPWIHNGENWIRIEKDGSLSTFNYLKLFPEMTYIEQVRNELWLIDNHQFLYKFIPSTSDSIPPTQMFFRNIRDRGGLIAAKNNQFNISYERNSVFIEMSRPDYLGLMNVEYQYRLHGLNDEWSVWTRNHLLDFNYLPAGNYTLEVRSRDTFGRIQTSVPVGFKIVPPYWQTAWFNALQVMFFVGLVIMASRLNRQSNDDPKLTLLTNILTIVTIVMVIELLQNLAQSYFGDLDSPVMAFGLDVFVALLIFPVEQILKKIVTGSRASKPQPI